MSYLHSFKKFLLSTYSSHSKNKKYNTLIYNIYPCHLKKIEKYLYKLSTFNLANKPYPKSKSSVLYISNHCINQRNHAHSHYF